MPGPGGGFSQPPEPDKGKLPHEPNAPFALPSRQSLPRIALTLADPIGPLPIFATPAQAFLLGRGGRIVYDPSQSCLRTSYTPPGAGADNNQISHLQKEARC